jgi:acyl-CoA thioesterase-1
MRARSRTSGLLTSCRLAALAAVWTWAAPATAAKIACVGDSITYGYGLATPSQQSYPAVLQGLVGASHTVQNFGSSGCTMLKKGDKPYWNDPAYGASDAFKPDIVVIMLGTNDAKPQNWTYKADFAGDYASMISHYRAAGATVYVAAPPPVYASGGYSIDPNVFNTEVEPQIRQIATTASAPLIDVYQALSGKASDFPDNVHPNAEGAQLIAQAVAAALQAGGLGGNGGASGAGGAIAGGGGSSGGGGAPPGAGGASGGTTGTGGRGGSGGTTAGTGGASGAGGRPGSGGATSGTGGARTSGGAPGGGGVGPGSGGAADAGGAPGAGGALSGSAGGTGGGGSPSTGGAVGVGGQLAGSGGGTVSSGGTRAGAGGATMAVLGGAPGAGGAPTGAGGATGAQTGKSAGCGCRMLAGDSATPLGCLLALLLLGRGRARSRHGQGRPAPWGSSKRK